MPEIAVAFTVSGQREKYFRQALDSWAGVRGVRDAVMVFCVEPHRAFPLEEFGRWAGQVFPQTMVCPNPAVLGCHANTWRAFQQAFDAGARLGVMAEEDLVVSADVLEYLTWAMEEYEDDEQVTAVCAHARDSAGDGYDDAVVRASWFSPLVCGTWKDRWESFISPRWRYRRPGDPVDLSDAGQAWDTNLRSEIVRAGQQCVFPVRSRVQHIGEFSTWMTPVVAEFTYPDSRSGCFAPDHQVGRFREVPFRSVPGLRVLPGAYNRHATPEPAADRPRLLHPGRLRQPRAAGRGQLVRRPPGPLRPGRPGQAPPQPDHRLDRVPVQPRPAHLRPGHLRQQRRHPQDRAG